MYGFREEIVGLALVPFGLFQWIGITPARKLIRILAFLKAGAVAPFIPVVLGR